MRYDFQRRVGFVYMPNGCCTDFGGATGFFEAIDPNVQMVVTFAGDELDTSYFRTDTVRRGTPWVAVRLEPQSEEIGVVPVFSPSDIDVADSSKALNELLALPESWPAPRPLRTCPQCGGQAKKARR